MVKERLSSLDILRGADMFLLLALGGEAVQITSSDDLDAEKYLSDAQRDTLMAAYKHPISPAANGIKSMACSSLSKNNYQL